MYAVKLCSFWEPRMNVLIAFTQRYQGLYVSCIYITSCHVDCIYQFSWVVFLIYIGAGPIIHLVTMSVQF